MYDTSIYTIHIPTYLSVDTSIYISIHLSIQLGTFVLCCTVLSHALRFEAHS